MKLNTNLNLASFTTFLEMFQDVNTTNYTTYLSDGPQCKVNNFQNMKMDFEEINSRPGVPNLL